MKIAESLGRFARQVVTNGRSMHTRAGYRRTNLRRTSSSPSSSSKAPRGGHIEAGKLYTASHSSPS